MANINVLARLVQLSTNTVLATTQQPTDWQVAFLMDKAGELTVEVFASEPGNAPGGGTSFATYLMQGATGAGGLATPTPTLLELSLDNGTLYDSRKVVEAPRRLLRVGAPVIQESGSDIWSQYAMLGIDRATWTNCYLCDVLSKASGQIKSIIPTTPTISGSAGALSWKVTWVTNGVESVPSLASATAALGAVVTVPVGGGGTTARRVYRNSVANPTIWRLTTTIIGNAAATYTDNNTDASIASNQQPPQQYGFFSADGSIPILQGIFQTKPGVATWAAGAQTRLTFTPVIDNTYQLAFLQTNLDIYAYYIAKVVEDLAKKLGGAFAAAADVTQGSPGHFVADASDYSLSLSSALTGSTGVVCDGSPTFAAPAGTGGYASARLVTPPAAPVLTAVTATSPGAGAWTVGLTYVTAAGETNAPNTAAQTVTGTQAPQVAAISGIPTNITQVKYYQSTVAGNTTLGYVTAQNVVGGAVPAVNLTAAGNGAQLTPATNTAADGIAGTHAGVPRAVVIGSIGAQPGGAPFTFDGSSNATLTPAQEANTARIWQNGVSITPSLQNYYQQASFIGGATNGAGLPPGFRISSVVTLNNNAQDGAVTTCLPLVGITVGDVAGGLYYTISDGQFKPWPMSPNLPVYDVTVDPAGAGTIYIATTQGVYSRNATLTDLTTAWTRVGTNNGLPLKVTRLSGVTLAGTFYLYALASGNPKGQDGVYLYPAKAGSPTGAGYDGWSYWLPGGPSQVVDVIATDDHSFFFIHKADQNKVLLFDNTAGTTTSFALPANVKAKHLDRVTTASAIPASITPAVLTPVISSGVVTSITVTSGGSGYLNDYASLEIDNAAGGTGLTGYCTVSGGVIQTVVVQTGGSGYGGALAVHAGNAQDSVWVTTDDAQGAYYLLYGGNNANRDWVHQTLQQGNKDTSLYGAGGSKLVVCNRFTAGHAFNAINAAVLCCCSNGLFYLPQLTGIPTNGAVGWVNLNGGSGLDGVNLISVAAGQVQNLRGSPSSTHIYDVMSVQRLFAISPEAFYDSHSTAAFWRNVTKEPLSLGPFFTALAQDANNQTLPDNGVLTIGPSAGSPFSGAPAATHIQAAVLPTGWYWLRQLDERYQWTYRLINSNVALPSLMYHQVSQLQANASVAQLTASAQLAAVVFSWLKDNSQPQTLMTLESSFTQDSAGLRKLRPTMAVLVTLTESLMAKAVGAGAVTTPIVSMTAQTWYVLEHRIRKGDASGTSARTTTLLGSQLKTQPITPDDIAAALIDRVKSIQRFGLAPA